MSLYFNSLTCVLSQSLVAAKTKIRGTISYRLQGTGISCTQDTSPMK